jgi:hypothetical protein
MRSGHSTPWAKKLNKKIKQLGNYLTQRKGQDWRASSPIEINKKIAT